MRIRPSRDEFRALASGHTIVPVWAELLADLHEHAGAQTILATTTSSLSVQKLGDASGRPERFVGLHVFNPVPRMDLIEVAYTDNAMDVVRSRVKELVGALAKAGFRETMASIVPG